LQWNTASARNLSK